MRGLWAIAVLLLTGCATQFARPAADAFGPPPQAYEVAIKAYFETALKDPESARYRIGQPVRAYGNKGLAYGGDVTWTGYLVDVQVNAKNSFGGYVGFTPYIVLFDGESVRRVIKADDSWSLATLHRF